MCIRREFPTSDNRNIVPYPKNVRIIKSKSIFTISSVLFKIDFKKKFDRLINMAFFLRYLDCKDFGIRFSHFISP